MSFSTPSLATLQMLQLIRRRGSLAVANHSAMRKAHCAIRPLTSARKNDGHIMKSSRDGANRLASGHSVASVRPNGAGHSTRTTHDRHGEYSPRQRDDGLDTLAKQKAMIALGSNMGDRVGMIQEACRQMDRRGIMVLRTSGLWETEAMYVEEQDPFVNGVCEVETSFAPIELLDQLQGIETSMGRVKTVDKGPRNIDLDILIYSDRVVDNPRLSIPHRLMLERPFVLQPLCELIPNETLPPPHSKLPFHTHLRSLPKPSAPLSTLTPLSRNHAPLTPLTPTRRTQIMAVLNLTPDSFSDGGVHSSTDMCTLSTTISTFLNAGASILDLGGQSTRPGAHPISADEELSRILPAIALIRSLPHGKDVVISIDTYRAPVAKAAILAGADMINDVSGGTLDTDMLPTVARLGCTICLMHMRGTPETMNSLAHYPIGLIPTIGSELACRVRAAEEAGIRRWRIILDPGIGFAKNASQNLDILRQLRELRDFEGLKGLPWLVGTSRKGFIGRVTGVKEPRERTWGTAACVAAAVQGGADLVRVHDVGEMSKVVAMADAIWRV